MRSKALLPGGVGKSGYPGKDSVKSGCSRQRYSGVSGALRSTKKERCLLHPLLTGFLPWGLGQLHYTNKESLRLHPLRTRLLLGALRPPNAARKESGWLHPLLTRFLQRALELPHSPRTSVVDHGHFVLCFCQGDQLHPTGCQTNGINHTPPNMETVRSTLARPLMMEAKVDTSGRPL